MWAEAATGAVGLLLGFGIGSAASAFAARAGTGRFSPVLAGVSGSVTTQTSAVATAAMQVDLGSLLASGGWLLTRLTDGSQTVQGVPDAFEPIQRMNERVDNLFARGSFISDRDLDDRRRRENSEAAR